MKLHFLFGAALLSAGLGSMVLGACGSQPEGTPPSTHDAEQVAPTDQAQAAQPAPVAVRRRGMKRFRGGLNQDSQPTCNSPKLTYYGGPLIQSPIIVPVFWSSAVNPKLTAATTGMAQFFADITQSTYWPWLQEYDTVGVTNGSQQAILSGTATAGVTLSPSVCAGAASCTVTDKQIQSELTKQIGMSVLPAPTLDCTGNVQTIYMIEFPPNVTVNGGAGLGVSCQAFCAYHNTGTYGTNKTPLLYGVLMDQFTGPCAGMGCGGNPTPLEDSTDTASHELVEAVTDPDIGLTANIGSPMGWYDASNQCGEIADICDDGSAGDQITVNGRTWAVQQVWSNKQGKCASSGTVQSVCTGNTVTNCRKCSCGDNGNACPSGETCGGGGTQYACGGSTCTPLTTCPAPDNCGTISDNCGGMLTCGTCATGQTCGGGGTANVCGTSCTPLKTCPAGDNCGTISDGCGGMVVCGGTCPTGETCGGGGTANVCGASCTPLTRCPTPDNCGTISDGCGGMLNCGTCATGQTCGGGGTANVCGSNTCVPKTACPAGDDCGTVSDGCGGMLDCGTCTAPQTCGGTGTPNVCGCLALATCPAGLDCGTVSNGCGGMLFCGTCATGQSCGGGGTPNVCGSGICVPLATCPAGDNCGTVSNGCGGMLDCGTCPTGQTCGGGGTANVCGSNTCVPKTACPAGDDCGTESDGCGGMIDCGTCTAPQTCGGGSPSNPNQCGCTPQTTCVAGYVCGMASDGCGGMFSCGTCPAGQTCMNYQCVPGTSTSSSSSGTGGSGATTSSSSSSGTGGSASSTSTSSSSGFATSSSSSGFATSSSSSGVFAGAGGNSTGTGEGGGSGAGGDGSNGNNQSGCGCETVGDSKTSNASLSLFGVLALAGAFGSRRRRR